MAKAYEGNADDLRIVLLGVSGAGKSSIGNAILGREVFKESRTRESEIQRGRVEDRNISIIDTPGFFNTHLTDEEMKKQMMKSLYLSDPGPHVYLLIINLENIEEEQRNIVEQIQENFGEESLLFTMVLFIGREKISRRKCIQIIESEEILKILNNFEGRFHVINSKNECDPNQITKLLTSIDEMVKNNGGQNYSNEIYLKNMRKLRDQEERMIQEEKRLKQEEERTKQEQVRKRQIKREKIQEAREAWKQKRGIGQEEEIKTKNKEKSIKHGNEKKKEDVKERAQYVREKEAAIQKDLRKQMESRREKERQRWKLEREMTQEDPSRPDSPEQQEESKEETNGGDNEMHQEEEINTQSKDEMNEGDNERNQEATERQRRLRGLFRDHLLGLMMGLELSEMALRLSLARAMAHNLSRQDLRIVLLGLLGSGKSSTGNTILNRDAFTAGLRTTTRTCEKREAVVYGRTISIIDTPAIILNGSLFMAHQRCEIEKSLEMSAPGPHVFLLMINLLEFTEEKNTVKWIQENFEKDALNHTVVLFTHDDLLDFLIDEPLNEYFKKSTDLQSLIDSCGGRFHSFNNKAVQNRFQVIELLVKIDKMMERNGGKHYTKHNIFKRAQNNNQPNTTQDDSCIIL